MQTHDAKRVEIVIEAPLLRRLTDALEAAGVTGYSVLPVHGGSGRSGPWTADGQVGRGGMACVICLVAPERLDALLDGVLGVLERYLGVVSVTDAQVVRAERF